MISAMMSREFGWGVDITKEQLEKVNEMKAGEKYRDVESAMAKQGTANKSPLTDNPFIREFEYGAKGEGYWSYEHMVIQLEDCIDCLKVLYPQYTFVFLLDHSCGHDRQREDGLNAGKMSKSFGGRQKKLRDTAIKQENGYLGPYNRTLRVGDVRRCAFKALTIIHFG